MYETRVLHFVEREIRSGQVRGKHQFKGLGNLRIDWTGSRSQSIQEEPDLRFFTDNYRPRVRNGRADTLYSIQTAIYPYPTRYFRDLEEANTEGTGRLHPPLQAVGRACSLTSSSGATT